MMTSSLLITGLMLHIVFLFAIFDIYFKSPIVTGLNPLPNKVVPMGKRVVLISADGLRLDSIFDKDRLTEEYVLQYVQNIIQNRGSWAVSQSHLPTESRPGHVAMLAGLYEDPSAVTKGWKENPVDFDSIFNRSHCSFAWGSPDILNIFFKGLKHNCAFMESYTNEQNFAGDSRKYDNWVYEKVKEFMKFSQQSTSLYDEGIFFFLHLLGQDTSGHKDKPHTGKYLENLRNVDKLVEKIEDLFEEFYGDGRTTFVFTSDHGMTDWGSHGAGSVEEANTPFVAWGAGIKKPTMHSNQINIDQADITPLLAVLLGSPIPVNSVGVLPVSFLNMSKKQIAEAVFLNSRQICAQYVKTLQDTEADIISWLYFPFKRLKIEELNLKVMWIKSAISSEKYSEAITNAKDLIDLCLAGLDYYQNYYQGFLLLCVSLTYLIWIVFLSLKVFALGHSPNPAQMPKSVSTACCLITLLTFLLIFSQNLPLSFYTYAMLPQYLGYYTVKEVLHLRFFIEGKKLSKYFYLFLCVMLNVEILVASFFHRSLLCLLVGIILMWSVKSVDFKRNQILGFVWLASGGTLGLFAFLPVVGSQPNPNISMLSSLGLCCLSLFVFLCLRRNALFFSLQFAAMILSAWNNYTVHTHFNDNQELLFLNQFLSWFLLFFSLCLLLFSCDKVFENLHRVFTTLSIPFILLTITHESFFLFLLFIHLTCWIFVEKLVENENQTFSHFRQAYFFLSYIFLSFFGLGNISSLNSFDPAWVRCFLTVFSPFAMSGLILLKTIIPFLVVTCALRVLASFLNLPLKRLFTIVLIYCNVMGLNFLFLVRNKGSWLDIGTSISHYVIQQVTVVFLVVLYGISRVLIPFAVSKPKQRANFPLKTPEKKFLLPTFFTSSKVS